MDSQTPQPIKNSETKRVPRPMGLTHLCKEYHQNGTQDNKDKIYKFLINQYTLNGFRYAGISLSVTEFSQIFKIEESIVLREINELSTNLGSFNSPEQINNTLKSIASLSTMWSIQDKGLISNQIDLLLKAQNGSYKPFISSEVNKALKLGLDSNKNLMELYKTFSGQNQNILNILNVNNTSNNYITPEKALDFIEETRKKERKELKESNRQYMLDRHIEENDLSSSSFTTEAQILNKDELDILFQEQRLGTGIEVRENRTGAQALLPPDSQGVTEPNEGQKALIPDDLGPSGNNAQEGLDTHEAYIPNIFMAPKKKAHNDPFSRRGEPGPIED